MTDVRIVPIYENVVHTVVSGFVTKSAGHCKRVDGAAIQEDIAAADNYAASRAKIEA